MIIPKEERTHSNLFYRKLYRVWWHMKGRCLNPSDRSYRLYGGNGVTICEKWLELDGFLHDVDKIDGWDKDMFMTSNLQLDKDLKVEGNKVYSPEFCLWVSPDTNVGLRPNLMRPTIALTPEGKRIRYFNTAKLCRDHGLNKNAIRECLLYRLKNHHGWQFRYEDEEGSNPFLDIYESHTDSVIVMDMQGNIHKYTSGAEFLRSIGRCPRTYGGSVSDACNGKISHTLGYQVQRLSEYSEDKFVDPKTLRAPKGALVLGVAPDGNEYHITNRQEFSKEQGLDARRIADCLNGKIKQTKGWKFYYK